MYVRDYMWKTKENLQESVFSFYYASCGAQTWVVRCNGKRPYPLNCIAILASVL